MTSLGKSEGHTEEGEELARLFVGVSGSGDDNVHAADFINLIVVDFGEDELFLDAEGVIASAVEGIAVDASEVADAGQGDIHELIEEFIHTATAQGDFAADSHTLPEFPSGEGFTRASDDGFLTGNSGEVGDSGFENFGITDGVAASHIEDNFIELGNLHDVFIVEFSHHSGNDFGFIFIKESGQGNTSLFDSLAAFFADAGIFAVNELVSDTSGLIASWADELNFADVKWHFLRDNAALGNLHGGFGVAFNFVNAFDDDFSLIGHGGDNFALLALILAGEDCNGIALFNVKFHLEHLRSEGDNFHEVFIAEFASDGTEDTSAAGSFILFDDDGGIFVETDIGAVGSAKTFFGANDDGFNDVAFFDLTAGSGGFYGGNDNVTDIGVTAEGAAEDANTHNFLCAGIIADVKARLLLNQGETSLLSLFDDADEAMAFKFGQGTCLHDSDLIAELRLAVFVVSEEFNGTFNGFFIEFMLNEFLNSDDDSLLHFSGNDDADASFTFIAIRILSHVIASLLTDIEFAFADDSFKLSDGAFNLANAHGIIELPCSVLKAEVKEFFFEGFNFIELFCGLEVADFINLHAYHRLLYYR